jgi:hypothetical protein
MGELTVNGCRFTVLRPEAFTVNRQPSTINLRKNA